MRPKNSFSLNLLGEGSIISANYNRIFISYSEFFLSGKLGFGYGEQLQLCFFGPCSSPAERYLTIPTHFTGNVGSGIHFFEFGFGATLIDGASEIDHIFYPVIGYRIQPRNSGKINFRLSVSVPVAGSFDVIFIPVGLSIGVCF